MHRLSCIVLKQRYFFQYFEAYTFFHHKSSLFQHFQVSFDLAEYTANVDAVGTLRLLDAIKTCGMENHVRFYQVLIIDNICIHLLMCLRQSSLVTYFIFYSVMEVIWHCILFCRPLPVRCLEKSKRFLKVKKLHFTLDLHMVSLFHKQYTCDIITAILVYH